ILLLPRPPGSDPFPYTTLFRSIGRALGYAGPPSTDAAFSFSSHSGARGCPRAERLAGSRTLGARTPGAPRGQDGAVRARRLYGRSEEHTSELQSRENLVCRLLL